MKRILLIEDDRFYAKMMRRAILGRFEEIDVEIVERMEQARESLRENRYDLVVADLHLPDSEGEHIRELVEAGQSVVVVTGDTDNARKKRITKLDIVDYIVKSHNPRFDYLLKLIARLRDNVGKTILVAKDASAVRDIFKRFLARQNLRVLCAADGLEAMKILEKERVDIVLSDYNMPKIDGLELLLAVRERHEMLELPFIAVSADGGNDTVGTFLKLGANDFLKKPFSKEELLCRINNTLDTVEMFRQIRDNAITDILTGLYNRRYLYEVAPGLVAATERYGTPLSLAMFDIDHFKRVNDTYGHLTGDRVLREVARVLKEGVRASDIVVRYGGEEFLVLMPGTDLGRAFIVAEKLRRRVESTAVVPEESDERVTVSGGVAQFIDGMDLEDLIRDADEALYRAKRSGRNRIEMQREKE